MKSKLIGMYLIDEARPRPYAPLSSEPSVVSEAWRSKVYVWADVVRMWQTKRRSINIIINT